MHNSILRVRNLNKEFKLGSVTVPVLRGITLDVRRGELLGIAGPSGSGKSTLLGLIGGLDSPTSGMIELEGRDISRLSERQLTRVRSEKIGFVFQFFNLIPTLTALENVALPLHFAPRGAGRKFNPAQRAAELLRALDMADRLHHRPAQLSGGQQQRVAIARALANNPPLILADEPTGNLNTEAGALVMDTLQRVQATFGTTVVVVTHDRQVAAHTDRVLRLIDGTLAGEYVP
jgi:putative ABC transport system ATP-binding protein